MLRKGLFLLLLSAAYLNHVSAQTENEDSLKNTKFYYFKKSGSLTDQRDSAYFTRIMTPDPAGNKLFILEDVYYNGKPRLNGKSLTPGPYFKGQGDFKRYYPDGQVQETVTYENGKIIGRRTLYYANGKLQESATYADGKLTGERMTYYPNGNKQFIGRYANGGIALNSAQFFPNGKPYYTSVFDTTKKLEIIGDAYGLAGNSTALNGYGTWVTYADTFKRVFSKGPIVNGLKDGEWKGKLSDTLTTFVCVYKTGVLLSGTTYQESGKVIHFTREEVEPTFKGGLEAFYKLLAANTRYPKQAKLDNIQGKVFLSFIIEKDGELDDIKVVRGIGGGCDEAAVEALKKTSEPWIPGSQYGLPVHVQYNIPLTFSLQE